MWWIIILLYILSIIVNRLLYEVQCRLIDDTDDIAVFFIFIPLLGTVMHLIATIWTLVHYHYSEYKLPRWIRIIWTPKRFL